MPFIEVDEVPEGAEEAQVISIEEAEKQKTELQEKIDSLQEQFNSAVDSVAQWQQQANDYSKKYTDLVLSRKTSEPDTSNAPTIKTSIKELFVKKGK